MTRFWTFKCLFLHYEGGRWEKLKENSTLLWRRDGGMTVCDGRTLRWREKVCWEADGNWSNKRGCVPSTATQRPFNNNYVTITITIIMVIMKTITVTISRGCHPQFHIHEIDQFSSNHTIDLQAGFTESDLMWQKVNWGSFFERFGGTLKKKLTKWKCPRFRCKSKANRKMGVS